MAFNFVLFDFDGTLADTAQCGVIATQQAFIRVGLPAPSEAQIIHAMGIPIEQSFKTFGAAHFSEEEFAQLLAVFRQIYAEKADSLITAFDGALPLLAKLKAAQKKVAIVSSKKANVLRKNAEFLGIDKFVDLFIGSDHVQNYKPAPDGIFAAFEQWHFKGDLTQAIYVGDATTDIQMGHSAGIKTCAVTWGAHSETALTEAKPTYIAHHFAELSDILLV